LVNTSLAKTFDLIYDYIDGYSYRGSTVGEITAKIRIIPLDTAGTGLSKYIAAYLKLAREAKNASCQITAMETIIQ